MYSEPLSDAAKFANLCAKAYEFTKRPLVIRSSNIQSIAAAAKAVKGSNSVIASANPKNAEELVKLAQENGHALAVTAPNLDELTALTAKIKESGFNNIILNFETFSLAEQFRGIRYQ